MQIISWEFVLFTVITLGIYYLFSRKAQNIWLLLASYIFYLFWDINFVLILLSSTTVNYLVGKQMKAETNQRKWWLTLGLLANLASFLTFRMADSGAIYRIIHFFSLASPTLDVKILMPIGFAYYTLQAISYLLDVYRRQIPACTNFIDFALYLSYFPKMISGPIERAGNFLPQLQKPRIVNNLVASRSLTLIIMGLVRKLLIAEILLRYLPKNLFSDPTSYTPPHLAFGLVLYGFWLYQDFAGYTDIVRGISGLLGIDLAPNFRQPYFSRNFAEFWNSWHISLSHWLRDYIYLPLSRFLLRRKFNSRHILSITMPPLATMLASGAWHSTGLYMIAWGALHGSYQIIERFITLSRPTYSAAHQPWWRKALSILVIFTLTILAWVPFGSGSFTRTLRFWAALFTSPGTQAIDPLKLYEPLAMIFLTLALDGAQRWWNDDLFILHLPVLVRAAALSLVFLAFLAMILIGDVTVSPFIYQGF